MTFSNWTPRRDVRTGARGPYRRESVILVIILAGLLLVPLVMIVSCAGLAPTEWTGPKPEERVTFEAQPKVRVALALNTRGGVSLPVIKVTGSYTLMNPETTTVYQRGARLEKSPVVALSSGIVIEVPDAAGVRKTVHLPRLRIIPATSGTLHVGKYRYRGVLDLVYNKSDASMSVINEVDLEDYVGSVVGAEMFYYWPREALRAQAVAVRTYTLAHVMENDRKRPPPEHDLTQHYLTAQQYHGVNSEQATTLEAAHSTAGQVLTTNGNVFRAYYSSCCGGHTEACGLVWDDYATIPPLAGKVCPYCKHSKHYDWTCTLKTSTIEQQLHAAGNDVGSVRDVTFTDSNDDGHYDRVTVRGSRRTLNMLGNDFRLAIGSKDLLSMNFKAVAIKDGYALTGHGWGHGVGMCQYGAYGMAVQLFNYERILEFYYPQTKLTKVY